MADTFQPEPRLAYWCSSATNPVEFLGMSRDTRLRALCAIESACDAAEEAVSWPGEYEPIRERACARCGRRVAFPAAMCYATLRLRCGRLPFYCSAECRVLAREKNKRATYVRYRQRNLHRCRVISRAKRMRRVLAQLERLSQVLP